MELVARSRTKLDGLAVQVRLLYLLNHAGTDWALAILMLFACVGVISPHWFYALSLPCAYPLFFPLLRSCGLSLFCRFAVTFT
jgi:hypothetical protein